MYVGLTIAYLGETLILRQVWPLVLLPLTLAYVNWVVIPLEQLKLSETFGKNTCVTRAGCDAGYSKIV